MAKYKNTEEKLVGLKILLQQTTSELAFYPGLHKNIRHLVLDVLEVPTHIQSNYKWPELLHHQI